MKKCCTIFENMSRRYALLIVLLCCAQPAFAAGLPYIAPFVSLLTLGVLAFNGVLLGIIGAYNKPATRILAALLIPADIAWAGMLLYTIYDTAPDSPVLIFIAIVLTVLLLFAARRAWRFLGRKAA